MNRYHRYQNVNSYWYDEVPDHWKKTKNKYVFHQDKKVVGSSWEDHVLLTMGKSGVKPRDMDGGGKFPASFENYQVVIPKQIIFCLFDLDETPRTVGKSSDHGMITSAYDVFSTTTENDPQFWTYFYQMIDDHKGLRPYYTGLRKVVRSETFMGIEVFSPPIEEQKLISRYLDKKTSQIDSLVEKIQKKIELLKEQRTSLINHYVTKGLDPNVEMKDSGIEWIGEIPKHWESLPIRYVTEDHRQGFYTSDPYDNEGVPILRITDIQEDHAFSHWDSPKYSRPEEEIDKFYVKNGDFLFPRTGGVGRFGIVDFDFPCIYGSFMIRFRWNRSINRNFMKFFLESSLFTDQVKQEIHGGVNQNVHVENIKDVTFFRPQLEEQSDISEHLQKKCSLIDQRISLEKNRVSLLSEYRQSLISSVVTGKIRVTEDMI